MNNLSQNWQKSIASVVIICGMSFSILMLCLAASSIKNSFFGKRYSAKGPFGYKQYERQYEQKQDGLDAQNASDNKESNEGKDGNEGKYKNANRYPKYDRVKN